VIAGDSIGAIADGFGLPSWKYLYQINQSNIGADPHLLRPGTQLEIPQWDTTSGDEKLMHAGFDVFSLCGGTCFRYPWVPFSLKLRDEQDREVNTLSRTYHATIVNGKNSKVLLELSITRIDELNLLLPDAESIKIDIPGLPFTLG
jgi:hypothetical protein